MLRRLFISGVVLVLLALALAGCVAQPSSEQAVALTATAASHTVPGKDSGTAATATPASGSGSTSSESATPAPKQSEISSKASLSTGTQAGQLAPAFTLPDETGKSVSLSDFRGQPVAMIFWASWCPYCKEELPLLQSLYDQYGAQGLVVVGVDLPGSKGETQEKALAFVEQNKITFPVLFDEGAQVFREYNGRGIPNLIFIDSEGVIEINYPGAMDAQKLEATIQGLVGAQ
jgi:peroxiredoxin